MPVSPHRSTCALACAALFAHTAILANEDVAWALEGARIYTAPDVPAIEQGVVVVRGASIAAVGPRATLDARQTRFAQCRGGYIAAGFQNSHVHFTGAEFAGAATRPVSELSSALNSMLLRYGYSTVVDVASDRDNTLALRARIAEGELPGPRILTAGLPLFPPQGLPAYIAHFPRELRQRLPQPDTAAAAIGVIRENMDTGVEAAKLFLATPQADGSIRRMPREIAIAAAQEAHRRGGLVLAHPTDIDGVRAALEAGVDVLVHTTLGARSPWPAPLLREVIAARMTVAPTLKLLGYELQKEQVPAEQARDIVAATVAHFSEFVRAGGRVLFGTDVGYMTDFDPTAEYELLARAGLTPAQILASLTTMPAALWKEDDRRGRLAPGMQADLVVLSADPVQDPRNFADVRCLFRAGELIYPTSQQ